MSEGTGVDSGGRTHAQACEDQHGHCQGRGGGGGECWCVPNGSHCARGKSNFPSTLLSSSGCRSDNDTDMRQNDERT